MFGAKKDGKLHLGVDYIRLDALGKTDSYPMPRIDDCIDSFGKCTIFSTLDTNRGYWEVEFDDKEKDKPVFTLHHGLCRFTRMPFELKNVPGTFQRAMGVILVQ